MQQTIHIMLHYTKNPYEMDFRFSFEGVKYTGVLNKNPYGADFRFSPEGVKRMDALNKCQSWGSPGIRMQVK